MNINKLIYSKSKSFSHDDYDWVYYPSDIVKQDLSSVNSFYLSLFPNIDSYFNLSNNGEDCIFLLAFSDYITLFKIKPIKSQDMYGRRILSLYGFAIRNNEPEYFFSIISHIVSDFENLFIFDELDNIASDRSFDFIKNIEIDCNKNGNYLTDENIQGTNFTINAPYNFSSCTFSTVANLLSEAKSLPATICFYSENNEAVGINLHLASKDTMSENKVFYEEKKSGSISEQSVYKIYAKISQEFIMSKKKPYQPMQHKFLKTEIYIDEEIIYKSLRDVFSLKDDVAVEHAFLEELYKGEDFLLENGWKIEYDKEICRIYTKPLT